MVRPWCGPAGSTTARSGPSGETGALALFTAEDTWLLMPRPEAAEAAGSDLDSSLVALALADLPEHHERAPALVGRGGGHPGRRAGPGGGAAAPGAVDQISEWAEARRRMPPKTTFFSPKPRTGMVFRRLDDPD